MATSYEVQIFGDFLEEIPISDDYITLNFSPDSSPRKRPWEQNGISADFLGDYFSAFFPGDPVCGSKINRKDTIKGVVSYIANELLENAVKFSDWSAKLPISITLYLYEEELIFYVSNYANQVIVDKYKSFIEAMLASDIDQLYTRQLEKSGAGGESNMGLLTMINDYSARLGWKFNHLQKHPDLFRVTVIARLNI